MLVDDTGIEPVTPTMSMWCSTAEPIVQVFVLHLSWSQSTLPRPYPEIVVQIVRIKMANFVYGTGLSRNGQW